MRFRDASPTITDAGRSPSDDKGRRNGHLLAVGNEQENLCPPLRGESEAIRFLADRNIKWWRSARSGDERGRSGPTRNLASSAVTCVLTGSHTWQRRWVKYEIARSVIKGNGLPNVHIHRLKRNLSTTLRH